MIRFNGTWKRITGLLGALACLACVTAPAFGQLHAWYDFENGSDDASGNGNHGTFVGNPLSSSGSGLFGNYAFENDGSSNNYMWSDLQISPSVAPEVTIGAWVNVNDASSYQTLIQSDGLFARKIAIDDRGLDAGATGNWTYSAFGGRTIGVAEDDWHAGNTHPLREDTFRGTRSVIQGDTASGSDGWVFVATTYNSRLGETALYTGANKTKMVDSYPFTPADNARWDDPLHIGSIAGTYENFNGRMDNVFVFQGALDDTEINSLRTAANPLVTAKTIDANLESRKRREWKLDFNAQFANHNNLVPTGIDGRENWNALETGWAFTVVNPSISNMADTNGVGGGVESSPDFAINGNVKGFSYNAEADPVGGDYMYWGDNSSTSASITWSIDDLDPSKHYQITPVGGSVQDFFNENNERRRFLMSLDSDGDGDLDSTRLMKMARGAAINFVAKPDVNGTIIGSAGGGGDIGNEANWGGLIITEIDPADETIKLQAAPIHRYTFNGSGTSTLADTGSIGGADGQIRATLGAPSQLDGSGKMKLDLSTGFTYGELPTSIMDNLSSATIETWFTYTADPTEPDLTRGGFNAGTPLFSFGDGDATASGEKIQQLAKGTEFNTPYTYPDRYYHEVQMFTDEAGFSGDANVLVGDNLWSQGNDYHVAITFDASAGADGRSIIGYYLNGALVKQSLTDALLSDIDFQHMLIGATQDLAKTIVMDYDEFRIYDYALTGDEVLGNFILGADTVNFDPLPTFIAGDVSGDDAVGLTDLSLVLNAWGSSALPDDWRATDQFDGVVSLDELSAVLDNWGNLAGGGTRFDTLTPEIYALANSRGIDISGLPIPEPTSLALLAVAMTGLLTRRKRR